MVQALLFLVVLWTNAQTGRATDLTPPVIWLLAGVILYVLIDRYYNRTYGRVEPAGHAVWFDWIASAAFSAAAVGAFVLDMADRIPVSFFALVFSLGLLADYVRMIRLAGVKSKAIYPVGLICIAGIALSAFLTILREQIPAVFGFRSPILFVYALDAVIIVVYGVAGHFYLVRSMSRSVGGE